MLKTPNTKSAEPKKDIVEIDGDSKTRYDKSRLNGSKIGDDEVDNKIDNKVDNEVKKRGQKRLNPKFV